MFDRAPVGAIAVYCPKHRADFGRSCYLQVMCSQHNGIEPAAGELLCWDAIEVQAANQAKVADGR